MANKQTKCFHCLGSIATNLLTINNDDDDFGCVCARGRGWLIMIAEKK